MKSFKFNLRQLFLSLVLFSGLVSCTPDRIQDPSATAPVQLLLDNWPPPTVLIHSSGEDQTAIEVDYSESTATLSVHPNSRLLIREETPRATSGRVDTTCWGDSQSTRNQVANLDIESGTEITDLLPVESLFDLTHRTVHCQLWLVFKNSIGSTRKVGPLSININPTLIAKVEVQYAKGSSSQTTDDLRLESLHDIRVTAPSMSESVHTYLMCDQFTTNYDFPNAELIQLTRLIDPIYSNHPNWSVPLHQVFPEQSCLLVLRTESGHTQISKKLALRAPWPLLSTEITPGPRSLADYKDSQTIFTIKLHNPHQIPIAVELSSVKQANVKVEGSVATFSGNDQCSLFGWTEPQQAALQYYLDGVPFRLEAIPTSVTVTPGQSVILHGESRVHQTSCIANPKSGGSLFAGSLGFHFAVLDLDGLKIEQLASQSLNKNPQASQMRHQLPLTFAPYIEGVIANPQMIQHATCSGFHRFVQSPQLPRVNKLPCRP